MFSKTRMKQAAGWLGEVIVPGGSVEGDGYLIRIALNQSLGPAGGGETRCQGLLSLPVAVACFTASLGWVAGFKPPPRKVKPVPAAAAPDPGETLA